MHWRIQNLAETDIAVLESKLAFQNRQKYRILLKKQQAGSAQTFVVWAGDQPVGHIEIDWAGAHDAGLVDYRNCPLIKAVFVHPDWRKQGIAEQLIAKVELLVKQRGHKLVGLGVATNNAAALNLYEKLGYVDAGTPVLHNKRNYTDFAGNHIEDTFTAKFLIKKL